MGSATDRATNSRLTPSPPDGPGRQLRPPLFPQADHAGLTAVTEATADSSLPPPTADARPHGLSAVGARARLTFVCVPRCLPGTKPRVEVRKVIKTHTGPRGRPARRRNPSCASTRAASTSSRPKKSRPRRGATSGASRARARSARKIPWSRLTRRAPSHRPPSKRRSRASSRARRASGTSGGAPRSSA